MKQVVNKKDFDTFIKNQYESYTVHMMCDSEFKNVYTTVDESRGIIFITNIRTGKISVARCHKTDKFNQETGIAIAWAKYNGIEIPKCYQAQCDIRELELGDEFYFYGSNSKCRFSTITKMPFRSGEVYDVALYTEHNQPKMTMLPPNTLTVVKVCNNA